MMAATGWGPNNTYNGLSGQAAHDAWMQSPDYANRMQESQRLSGNMFAGLDANGNPMAPSTGPQMGSRSLGFVANGGTYKPLDPTMALGPGQMGRGGVMRPATPAGGPNPWDAYYQKMAGNQGFTGDVAGTVAQAGIPGTDPVSKMWQGQQGVPLSQVGMAGPSVGPSSLPGSSGAGGATTSGGVNGTPGYGGSFDINSWKDPGYDFRLSEGNKLIQGSAAARGNLLSGSTLKDLTNYGQGAASQEYGNAYNRFTGNRSFNYGVDTGDRAFDYLTHQGDQNYNLSLAQMLAGQGQFGTQGTANSNNLLATLLSQNTLAGGNANAAGTIGGSNAITGGINQAIAQMLGQSYVNRFAPGN